MRMLKLLVLAFAAALAAGCVYDYGVGKDFPHLEKSLIVIEGDIIAGGISEVRVSTTSKMETTRSASTKAEDYVLREPLCQVWVESAEGEVHTDPADDLAEGVSDTGVRARERARNAVAVADAEQSDTHGAGRREVASVADAVACRKRAYGEDRCVKGQNG